MLNAKANKKMGIEAIILAGGLGTRLRTSVSDVPKCMAPVAGKPFLQYVINYLLQQGVSEFVFSLGYMNEIIEHFLIANYPNLQYRLSIETEPLGTGGAIQLACKETKQQQVLIVNGDTFFAIDVQKVYLFHLQKNAACTLSLKAMQQFDRYGVVETNDESMVLSFKEKQFYPNGLINGGVYMLDKESLLSKLLPEKFSFEKDYLEQFVATENFAALEQDAYFIDIGIPQDFEQAQLDFKENNI